MRKISAVLPVYNEEKLLPGLLANIYPHVDEIAVVDGSPSGPSTDRTKEILKACDKVKYQSGKFATLDGAWDMAAQQNTGISAVTGDVILFLSADMCFSNLENLRPVVEAEQYRIFFCPILEFWIDIKHLRLYSADTDVLTVPSNLLDPIAIDRSYGPYCEENGKFHLDSAGHDERILIPSIIKYHLGWIRPFQEQVDKHIRHIQQHRWAEDGERLLRGGDRGLAQWAIRHVLSYDNTPSIGFFGTLPAELDSCMDMRYDDGVQETLDDFERRFGISPFKSKEQE